MYSYDEILNALLVSQALFTACYLIPALVISGDSFAGINSILLGILFVGFLTATYFVLKRELNRLNFGSLLGGAAVMAMMSLQSAIFWGQYGNCVKPDFVLDVIARYSREPGIGPQCNHRAAMSALCAFSVFMLLTYLVQIGAMVHFKNEILAEVPLGPSSYRPIPSVNPLQQSISVMEHPR